jgi:hypothetical protein
MAVDDHDSLIGHPRPNPSGSDRLSAQLLADLHAGNLPPDVAAALWPRVRSDPDAERIIAALDGVSGRLERLGAHGAAGASQRPAAGPDMIPPAVAQRIEAALLERSLPAISGTPRHGWARAVRPVASFGAVAASAVAAALLWWGPPASPSQPSTGTPSGSGAQRNEADEPGLAAHELGDELDPARILAFIGTSDDAASLMNLPECLAENGISPTAPLLGAAPATISGQSGVLLLVPSAESPGITALVVGKDCGPGRPSTIARKELAQAGAGP